MEIYGVGDDSYKNKIGLCKLLGYEVGDPKEGKRQITFEYGNEAKSNQTIKLVREFHDFTCEELWRHLTKKAYGCRSVDLSFAYVKGFNMEKIIKGKGEDSVAFSFRGEHAFFDGDTYFSRVVFKGKESSFANSIFAAGGLTFCKMDFGGNTVDFTDVFAERVLFDHCAFRNHDKLKFKRVKELKLPGCVISQTLWITGAEILSFKGTISLGYIYCDWEENQVGKAIFNNEDTIEEKGRQFAMLKQDYHRIGSYENEDKAFTAYMRCRRQRLRSKWLKALDGLIDLMGTYGTKPGRVAVTMLIVWIAFGSVFTGLDLVWGVLSQGVLENPLNGFYFSAITFLTIGYGDIVPLLTVAKILAPIEGLLGLFLMSYFTVSVVRRTLR
ncbi:MAG: potassium channel family protein [Anaerovorax sp.]